MKTDKEIYVDDYYIGRPRGMGRFVKCLTELCDRISLLHSFYFVSFPIWEQILVYARLVRLKDAVVIFPYNTAPIFAHRFVETVLVVHDLMFLDEKLFSRKYLIRPKSFMSFLYRRCIFLLVHKKAKSMIFVTENVEQDFLSRFYFSGSTYILHNTIVPELEKKLLINKRLKTDFNSDEINLLCVSGLAPTKNIHFLLQSLSEFSLNSPSIRWKLYLVGITSKDFKVNFAYLPKDFVEHIIILENIDDDRLAQLYIDSDILLFPSLTEGFGVPLIEAMAADLRIVCSNTSVMPSVCGSKAYYFDPESVADFIRALSIAIVDDGSSKKSRTRYLSLFSNEAFKNRIEFIIR